MTFLKFNMATAIAAMIGTLSIAARLPATFSVAGTVDTGSPICPTMPQAAITLDVQAKEERTPGRDLFGDPLPAGAIARLGTVRWRHSHVVGFAAFLPDGNSVISASKDGTVRVWEFPSGKEIRRILQPAVDDLLFLREFRPNSLFTAGALSPDGRTIATFFSGAIRLHDVASAKELPGLPVGNSGVAGLRFAPNGQLLASLDGYGTVRIWDWNKAKELSSFALPYSGGLAGAGFTIDFTPDSKAIVTSRAGSVKTAIGVKFWDAGTGKLIRNITQDSSRIFALSSDGKTVAYIQSTTKTSTLALADVATGQSIRELKDGDGKHVNASAMVFAKDGKKLYTYGGQSLVSEWDTATGKLLRRLGTPEDESTPAAEFGNLSLSPDESTVVIAGHDNALRFIDIRSGKESAESGNQRVPLISVQITPDGTKLLTRDSQPVIRQWEIASLKDMGPFKLVAPGLPYAISTDGRLLAGIPFGGPNASTIVDSVSGQVLGKLDGVGYGAAMMFSPDSKLLAINNKLYTVPFLKQVHEFDRDYKAKFPAGVDTGRMAVALSTPCFSPDSKLVGLFFDPKTLVFWNTVTGRKVAVLQKPEENLIDSVAISPDSRTAAWDMNDGTVVLYELLTGKVRITYGKKAPLPAVEAWKALQNTPPARFVPQTLQGSRIAFSPSGKQLAQAGIGSVVHVWDVANGNELAAFKGHTGWLRTVAFAPDGKSLASAGSDTTVLIWDLRGL